MVGLSLGRREGGAPEKTTAPYRSLSRNKTNPQEGFSNQWVMRFGIARGASFMLFLTRLRRSDRFALTGPQGWHPGKIFR